MDQKSPTNSKDIEEHKILAALSYVWILSLVMLLVKRDSPFVQFHAKQGLVLFIVEVIGAVVYWVPIFGWLLAVLLILVSVIGFFQALSGNWWKIPFVSQLAEKMKF